MKNIIKTLIFVAIFAPIAVSAESATPAPTPASTVAPTATSASNSGAPASSDTRVSTSPISTGVVTSATSYSAPSNTGTVTSAAPASTGTVVSTSPSNTGTVTSVGNAPSSNNGTNVVSGEGSTSSSGSRSSGSRYFGYVGCPLITTYMKYGSNNNVTEVTKLQNFLKNIEKLDVDVNGIFDRKTESAVIAFQNRYSTTTMGPWGQTKGTGYVYITTQKQINKIACNLPLTLNNNELAIINSSKSIKTSQVIITPKANIEVIKSDENTISISNDSASSTEVTEVENQTANVAKTSIMNKFWNFLIYLFK